MEGEILKGYVLFGRIQTPSVSFYTAISRRLTFTLFFTLVLFTLPCAATGNSAVVPDEAPHNYKQGNDTLSTKDCLGCHQNQSQKWKMSDHYKAMALPTSKTVLGNFNNKTAIHYNQKSIMFTRDNKYMVTVFDQAEKAVDENLKTGTTQSNSDSKLNSQSSQGETFTVKYTFGHYPLQQYLLETQSGRLQVMPFAWDSRSEEEGGQRWYHNYSNEQINANDRLHWRQPLQNWNGMCADCHSDELKRNYDVAENTFNTQYSNINVGCVSCHGVMNEHVVDGEYFPDPAHSKAVKHGNALKGQWTLTDEAKTAVWKGPTRNNEFMQTCFACHSLRSPLTDGFNANESFLDQFSPTFITDPLYHADGQIKEEVYVYGSFLQSKMFRNGVNCIDCHDPHTMKVKIEGNGLCLQCHKASKFDTPSHHRHEAFNEGAKCVNCHMPETTFMGVDDRRDHSFRIPRPDISNTFNTPNACADCHVQESNEWAAAKLVEWFGTPKSLTINQQNLLALRHGQRINLQAHLQIVNDTSIDTISRASALEMLPRSTASVLPNQIAPYVKHEHDLIRLAAARAATLIEPQLRGDLLSHLLRDDLRAIRVAAAQALVGVPLKHEELGAFSSSFNELLSATEISTWRAEGRTNLGSIALADNDQINAEMAFKATVEIEPYFAPGYVNLADLYRAKQREDLVAKVLGDGMLNTPDSADVVYSYGLHLVRTKNIEQAIIEFKKAMKLDSSNQQLAYTYVLALDGGGHSLKALLELKGLIGMYQYTESLKELGLYLSQKNNDSEAFQYFQSY